MEKINHPTHYNQYDVEVIDMMIKVFGIDAVINFCILNAFKYRMRMGLKDDINQDFAKEQWYLNKANELKPKSKSNICFIEWKDPNKELPKNHTWVLVSDKIDNDIHFLQYLSKFKLFDCLEYSMEIDEISAWCDIPNFTTF